MYVDKSNDCKDDKSIIEAFNTFTKREIEVLLLIGDGYSTKQIAGKLFISINTVETHRRHLLEKMQVKNSMELIRHATHALWLKETDKMDHKAA